MLEKLNENIIKYWKSITLITLIICGLYTVFINYSNTKNEKISMNELNKSVEKTVNIALAKLLKRAEQDSIVTNSIKSTLNEKDLIVELTTTVDLNHKYFDLAINRYEVGTYKLSSIQQKSIIIAFETYYTEFKKNFKIENIESIMVEVCGTADGIPIIRGTKYEDEDITIKYYSNNSQTEKEITLLKTKTNMTNEIFALLRGFIVKDAIENFFPELKGKIKLQTNTYFEKGADKRATSVKLIYNNFSEKLNL